VNESATDGIFRACVLKNAFKNRFLLMKTANDAATGDQALDLGRILAKNRSRGDVLTVIHRPEISFTGIEINTTSILSYTFEELSQNRKEITKNNVVLDRYYT